VFMGVRSQDAIFERHTYIQMGMEGGETRGNDKSGSSNKYSESRPGRARGIHARARTELFSRAPNRTLICDSDCRKFKGMPTLSLPLLHDLLDLINARCITGAGFAHPMLCIVRHAHPLARMMIRKDSRTRVNVYKST